MIPMDELAAWQDQAPWPRMAQIEQDLLLTRCMVAIFGDRFLREQVAMRGGTVLHKLHLAPATRYSEDIDLVLVGDRPADHIRKALRRVLRPILGEPAESVLEEIKLWLRNAAKPSKIIRIVYEFEPTIAPPLKAKVKIEVNVSETAPLYDLMHLPYAPPLPEWTNEPGRSIEIVSYAIDEILGTKFRALYQRSQSRDLYDIHRSWEQHEVGRLAIDTARVMNAFKAYLRQEDVTVSRSDFARNLDDKLASAAFRDDMKMVLPNDVAFDIDHAAEICRRNFLDLLD